MMEAEKQKRGSFEKIYFEITASDFENLAISLEGLDSHIEKIDSPSYEQYRAWHDLVGRPYGWHERSRINDREAIELLLSNPKVEMFILKNGASEVGYALIEEDAPGQVEISDFGFPPDKVAKGYGSVFFPMLLEQIFDRGVSRIWLSTRSTNDPKVVTFYEKFKLRIYKRELLDEDCMQES